jgi:hypothetical protein
VRSLVFQRYKYFSPPLPLEQYTIKKAKNGNNGSFICVVVYSEEQGEVVRSGVVVSKH